MPKHSLKIAYTQETDGKVDHQTVIEDFSDDTLIQVVKAKVFSKHLTAAADAIAQELGDMAIDLLSGKHPR